MASLLPERGSESATEAEDGGRCPHSLAILTNNKKLDI